jgi:diguanylate cyclase (GGDEF)-like protein/PAS domain S-box-containing protein
MPNRASHPRSSKARRAASPRSARNRPRKGALLELLEALARAANEAASPEAAMRTSLEQICEHGAWNVGRLGIYGPGEGERFPERSLWHAKKPARYAALMSASLDRKYFAAGGRFISVVLKEKKPVWLGDIRSTKGFGRMTIALGCNLRSAFAFPVIVGGEVAAFLEFFAEEPRAPDASLLEAITSVGAQLARLIERQRALTEARANERKLVDILGALHEVVWSMDVRSGRILYLNPAAQRLARRPVADFLTNRRTWWRMVHPADRAQVRDSIRALLKQGALTHEFRMLLADGEVRVLENRARVVRDAQGNPQRIDGTISDITERKRAEAERAHLAAIVDNSTDAIVSRDRERTILTWNAAAERMFGWSAAEVIGRHISLMIPPDQEAQAAQARALVSSGQTIPPYDAVRLTKDGRRIDVSMSQSPIKDSSGRMTDVSLVYRDISARKKAEAEILHLAHHDNLTGLPNRVLFYDRLGQALSLARREGYEIGLLYVDFDDFKAVNDRFGHDAGDELLRNAATRMRHQLRESDTLARIGGDEFTVILPHIASRQDAAAVATKIIEALSAPFHLGAAEREASIGTSIGIAIYPANAEDVDALVKAADAAMYAAKQTRNNFRFYDAPQGQPPAASFQPA